MPRILAQPAAAAALTILLALPCQPADAAPIDVEAVASGNYRDPAVWSGGVAPVGSTPSAPDGYRAWVDQDVGRRTVVEVDNGWNLSGLRIGANDPAAGGPDEVRLTGASYPYPAGMLNLWARPAWGPALVNDGRLLLLPVGPRPSHPHSGISPVDLRASRLAVMNTDGDRQGPWLRIQGTGDLVVEDTTVFLFGRVAQEATHTIRLRAGRLAMGTNFRGVRGTFRNEGLILVEPSPSVSNSTSYMSGAVVGPGEIRVAPGALLITTDFGLAGGRLLSEGGTLFAANTRILDAALDGSFANYSSYLLLSNVRLGPRSAIRSPSSGWLWLRGQLLNEGSITVGRLQVDPDSPTLDALLGGLPADFPHQTWSGAGTALLKGTGTLELGDYGSGNWSLRGGLLWQAAGHTLEVERVATSMAPVYNEGLFLIRPGGAYMSVRELHNAGQVEIGGRLIMRGGGVYHQTGGETVLRGRLESDSPILIGGGRLTGSGTIARYGGGASQLRLGDGVGTADAVLAPGASPGRMEILGDLALGADAVLEIELAGPDQGLTYDWLDVSGAATLDGLLRVLLDGAFAPSVGDVFTFLTAAGGVSGSFSALELLSPSGAYGMELLYGSGSVSLRVTALPGGGTGTPPTGSVPAPGSLALLATGVLVAAAARRRRAAPARGRRGGKPAGHPA